MKTQMTEQETTAATTANAVALELQNAYERIDALLSEKAMLEAMAASNMAAVVAAAVAAAVAAVAAAKAAAS